MERGLKKKDKLLEESEKRGKHLEEEYEYLGLRISSRRDSHMKWSGMLDVSLRIMVSFRVLMTTKKLLIFIAKHIITHILLTLLTKRHLTVKVSFRLCSKIKSPPPPDWSL